MAVFSTLGAALRRRREELGRSQEQVGAESGIQHGALSHYETGKRAPRIATLERWLAALGITDISSLCQVMTGGDPEIAEPLTDLARRASRAEARLEQLEATIQAASPPARRPGGSGRPTNGKTRRSERRA